MAKENMSVVCNKVVVDTTRKLVYLTTKPSKVNKSGAFKFTQQQFNNLAEQAGLSPKQLIRNAAGAKLSFDAEYCVAGTEWTREDKQGNIIERGVYGEKNGGLDSWKLTNYSVELSAQKQLNIEIAEAQAERMLQPGLSFDSFMNTLDVVQPAVIAEEPAVNGADEPQA